MSSLSSPLLEQRQAAQIFQDYYQKNDPLCDDCKEPSCFLMFLTDPHYVYYTDRKNSAFWKRLLKQPPTTCTIAVGVVVECVCCPIFSSYSCIKCCNQIRILNKYSQIKAPVRAEMTDIPHNPFRES